MQGLSNEMMKTQSDKSEILGPSNLARRQAAIQEKSSKIIKVTKFKMIPISRLPVLATPSGRRPNTGTCTESDNVNVSSDVNPTTNVEENDSYGQEGDNLFCLKNEILNEDNSSDLASVLGLDIVIKL